METSYPIVINVYDITSGLAKVFSPMLINKQVEAIYHTGICVYNTEFYYGGGIQKSNIKATPYGQPIKEIQFGTTQINKEVFEEFLNEVNPKFSIDKYDLIKNNCNHFVEECCQFLTGQGLPAYIIDQPNELLNTSLGQMIKPMIENIQNQVSSQPLPQQQQQQQNFNPNLFLPQFFEGQNNLNQMFPQFQQQPQQLQQQLSSQQQQQQQQQQQFQPQQQQQIPNSQQQDNNNQNVVEINDIEEFTAFLETSDAMIVDFFAQWCGPCKMISPIYDQMSNTYKDIRFYRVNGDKNKLLMQNFGITGFPTFITFFQQKQFSRFSGANQIKLKDCLDKLQQQLKNAQKQ